MTVTTTETNLLSVETAALSAVTFDLYRNIHKAIRRGLFDITSTFGSVDSADVEAVEGASSQLHEMVRFLVSHAEHEDTYVQPSIDRYLPVIAERVGEEHEVLERQMASLELLADVAAGETPNERRIAVHRTYLGLSTFVAHYLEHIAFEEVEIMPGLAQVMSVPELITIHSDIINSVPPADMATSLMWMMPAANVDDRAEMLIGMKDAPADVLQGVLGLTASVLSPEEFEKTKARAGIS